MSDDRNQFIRAAQNAREQRALERKRENSAVTIQAAIRGYFSRKQFAAALRKEFDQIYVHLDKSHNLPSALDSFLLSRKLMFIFDEGKDFERFLQLCRYLLCSVESTDAKKSCICVALTKEYILSWVKFMKIVLWQSCKYMEKLKTDIPAELKLTNLHLHMLVSFTAVSTWGLLKNKKGEALKPSLSQLCSNILNHLIGKGLSRKLSRTLKGGLCRSKPTLKPTTVSALITLSLRPLINGNFSEALLEEFTSEILTIPALIYHVQSMAQECVALLMSHRLFERIVLLLTTEHNTKAVFRSLSGVEALSLLANIIHLGSLEKQVLVENLLDFTNVVTRVLEKCRDDVVGKKSQTTHWHPVLGWFSRPLDEGVQSSMPGVVHQLEMLWSGDMVKCLFRDLVNMIPTENRSSAQSPGTHIQKDLGAPVKVLLRKLLDKQQSSAKILKKLGTPETTVVALVCSLYQSTLSTFTQLRYDILSGLCYQDFLLPRLWSFITRLGPQNGLRGFLELLAHNPKATSPDFQILILFCDAATYLITILDDVEVYEKEKPFQLNQLCAMGQLCNLILFRSVWENYIDVKSVSASTLFNSVHSFLMLLYHRDCRRTFVNNPNFWLVKDVKPSVFVAELEKGNKKAELLLQKVPHVIPHKERVILFRKYIRADREALGLARDGDHMEGASSTLVTVHRPRLVEDGYRQLSLLLAQTLKGVIRVKFVNEQGLDEAGIDQDGVFKEFLEETIRRVFDPSLNLFKTTSDGRLYPSSTSNIHENYLALFDFVGRMLGKAVYEGIVVEVPFASFFLTQVLGKTSGLGYSSIDELSSLDPELAKSLSYIKHYEGDVEDLDLTFSCNEDYMGQIVTHDLVPGGRTIAVNNQNKISYIHHMAHFRMYKQIREQVVAFVRGLRALIRPEWLLLFSVAELQKLISGSSEDIDIGDLRRHSQYYGGFHNSHRLINWLWEILEQDFTPEERRLFLKFVTSCSKPPLLGFAHMEPPFSIRCVEVGDDQDQGDTLGSVVRGFLTIRKKEPGSRLPTSSTCFNLLKLPNYQKKSTLREKLKYAILFSGSTGFELS